MVLIAYTTEFLNIVQEDEWIMWWKNWKKTTKITKTKKRLLRWWWHGQQHREGDKPAVISKVVQEWWRRGQSIYNRLKPPSSF
jgi:hypothetical protein